MRKFFFLALTVLMSVSVQAQRVMDRLDRGVVAVKTTSGVFVSWRIQADEYYDVTYNLYRDGSLVAEGLNVSNYSDAAGTSASSYTVEAVRRGQKLPVSAAARVWSTNYLEITPKHPSEILSTLVPNDACCADVDGDGELEILLKYDNQSEISQSYPKNGPTVNGRVTGEYSIFECLKLDGTVLWWVNCGPNMGDFQNNEQNIVGYDWDMDGKAEALFRAADGTTIHAADGQVYTIGDATKNYRQATGGGVNWFMHDGAEYLVYVNGATGVPYVTMEYLLKRLEAGETDLNKAWGDGYGHRSSKHFFGAPYLDGRKPSIFLARGIYTRHKFVALDVNPETHELTTRWRWTCTVSSSPWYGNGFHNYGIADVDMDGRDEICFGSMVIDDNGKGLSTTGYGHGDAQHHGDFDPYTWGLEIFTCLEEGPVYGNCLRDGTTGKLYYKYNATDDDGRAIMGNFTNQYPGAIGSSSRDPGVVGAVAHGIIDGATKNNMAQNFRIYWDGDLLEETFNYTNGKNTAGGIYKYNRGLIATLDGSMTNNDTKGTPCYQGDLFGDWREEVIMRTADNKIRIYTTTTATPWRNYSLWYDHQYRNAMVWQMCGYNQPPHTSYYLGELEGITVAPPALTLQGRSEVANGGTVSHDGQEVIACETNDMTINIADGATPAVFVDNAPSWVQGSAPSEATAPSYAIRYDYYTHTLQGGAFAGQTRVVKQGDGILVYPERDMTYAGPTDVWGGTLRLNGSIANSPLWLNRHTTLTTPERSITVKSLALDYGSTTFIGGEGRVGSLVATDSVTLGFGSRLKVDVFADGFKADQLSTGKLIVKTQNWQYGPAYRQPVVEFVCHFAEGETTLTPGRYVLGSVAAVSGNLADIKVEGIAKVKSALAVEDGSLVLVIEGVRDPADIQWAGTDSNVWDAATTANFVTHDEAATPETFIEDDNVYFTDDAANTNVVIPDGAELRAGNIHVTASKAYTFSGKGKIAGGTFHHSGTGTVTMGNDNTYSGGNYLTGGITIVSSLANATQDYGNLGAMTTAASKFTLGNGAALVNSTAVTNGSAMRINGQGIIRANSTFTQQGNILGDTLVKAGTAAFNMSGTLSASRVIVRDGNFYYSGNNYSRTVELQGSSSISGNGFIPSPIYVAKGAKATLTLTNTYYQAYSGALTGSGQLTINPTNTVNRVAITGNWTKFEGTIAYNHTSILMPLKNTGMPLATLTTGANTNIGIAASSDNASVTYPIGRLTGSGTLHGKEVNFGNSNGVSGTVTWKVGNTDLGDFAFDGAFYDNGGANKSNFEKVGDCTMTVSKAWQNSGTVKVSEGRLALKSSASLGTGALTVAEGATLSGVSGSIRTTSKSHPFTNSSVTVNGILRCGSTDTSTSGYLYFGTRPLTIGATGVLYVGISKGATSANAPGCTHIWGDETSGSITFRDGATVSVYLASGYDPAASIGTDEQKADSFCVFSFAKANVGNVQFQLPELPSHYYWDTSRFQSGYLYIRYTPTVGIRGTMADRDPQNVYDLRGRLVRRLSTADDLQALPAGVYIRAGRKVVIK